MIKAIGSTRSWRAILAALAAAAITWVLPGCSPQPATAPALDVINAMPSEHVAARKITIWLPPGYYDSDRHYPVLYMHDGQNLFDPATAYSGEEWGVDEAITRLSAEGVIPPTIVVGVWNTDQRWREYMPREIFQHLPADWRQKAATQYGGEPLSDEYLKFLVQELKPHIDNTYRTLTGPEHTAVMGSSMGGLISFYALTEYPDVFGRAGAVSIHWPLVQPPEQEPQQSDHLENVITAYGDYLGQSLPEAGRHRLYFDHGSEYLDAFYAPYQARIDELLKAHDWRPERDWISRHYAGATHNEAAWRARLDTPLTFLFANRSAADETASARETSASAPPDKESGRGAINRPLEDELIYFVMPDRFADGDSGNNTAGIAGGADDHGYDPSHKGYYHGGDFTGLMEKLDYIQGLGATAIWLTPIFKNKPVQGSAPYRSAGYHGYWITDFTRVDPHLGSNDEFQALVDAAHARGMKVIMDIVTNHTADVIQYRHCSAGSDKANGIAPTVPAADATGDVAAQAGGPANNNVSGTGQENGAMENGAAEDDAAPVDYAYRSTADYPYTHRCGVDGPLINPGFTGDAPEHQTEENFARLVDPSYAYRPYIPPVEAQVKVPAWLNNPIYYHNRGNSHWEGESSLYGDFAGLDDLFTEHPHVVQGMINIYKEWITRYKVDGFRIDTAKHVNDNFWRQFVPAIKAHARQQGIDDFYIFGEVYSFEPAFLARYTRDAQFPAVLDFALQGALRAVLVDNEPPSRLQEVFAQDHLYVGDERGAGILPTFLGNHDMGRLGHFLRQRGGTGGGGDENADEDELIRRTELAYVLLLFTRGIPVIYYGDEQGFTGHGGDQDARQDMFPSQVESYNDNRLLGTSATTADNNFDTEHPLYRTIAGLARFYHAHPALRRGHQEIRVAENRAGIFAFTREIAAGDPLAGNDEKPAQRFLVVVNTAAYERRARIPVGEPTQPATHTWYLRLGRGPAQPEMRHNSVFFSMAPLSYAVYQALAIPQPQAEAQDEPSGATPATNGQ